MCQRPSTCHQRYTSGLSFRCRCTTWCRACWCRIPSTLLDLVTCMSYLVSLGLSLAYNNAAVGAILEEALAESVSGDRSDGGEDNREDWKSDHFVVVRGWWVVEWNYEVCKTCWHWADLSVRGMKMLCWYIRFKEDCCSFIWTASSCSPITDEILWLAE